MGNFCHCEWLNRLITVNKSSRIITIQRLTQTHVVNRKYGFELYRETQPLPSEFDRCLTCETILDSHTGWRAPHLLVTCTAQHGNLVTYELLACDASGSFEPCGLQFAVKTSDLPSSDECYHLLDGPTVLWNQGSRVHIVRCENSEQHSVDLLTIAPHSNMEKIERIWCISSVDEDRYPSILLLVQLQPKEADYNRDFGALDFICLRVRLHGDKSLWNSKGIKVVRVPDVIPLDYGCIATCVASHRCSPVIEESSGGLVRGVVFVVGTKYQQVVLCEEGNVTHVIPLQDIPRHVVAIKGCEGIEVAVVSAGSSTCVYEVTGIKHKDKGRWSNTRACLAGDFAQLGRKQFLILDGTGDSDKTFHLTSRNILSTACPVDKMQSENMEASPLPDPPELLLNALKAVQLKKNTEAARLTHQKLALQHKFSLFSKSLGFLESLGRKSTTSAGEKADPGLVCLVPGKLLEEMTPSIAVESGTPSGGGAKRGGQEEQGTLDLHMLRVWQRVSGGKWIVGIVLRNISGRVLTGVGASILVRSHDPSPKESSCRVVWSDPSALQSSQVPPSIVAAAASAPPMKKRRLELLTSALDCSDRTRDQCDFEPIQHGQTFCLGVATEERSLGALATVVAFWKKEGSAGETCSEELTQLQLTAKSICNGELSINEHCLSLWNGTLALSGDEKFHTKEAQDLVCLLSTHSLTQVQANSNYTHLSRLPSMIRARLPLPEHALQLAGGSFFTSHQTTHPPMNKGACELLEGTALHIRLQSKNAVISILYKCQSHLELVLRLLNSSLPSDVRLRLVRDTEEWQHRTLLQSLNAIRQEAADRAKRLENTLEEQTEISEGQTVTITAATKGDLKVAALTDTKIKALSE